MTNKETINFNIGSMVTPWSTMKDFEGEGRKIAIIEFRRVGKEETKSKFLDKDDKTYRLTFIDLSVNPPIEKMLEIASRWFRDDLASSIRKEFGIEALPKGQICVLKTFMEQSGEKKRRRWYLVKGDGVYTDEIAGS